MHSRERRRKEKPPTDKSASTVETAKAKEMEVGGGIDVDMERRIGEEKKCHYTIGGDRQGERKGAIGSTPAPGFPVFF